ncbi:MAG TPA: plastocyanin/azurin family copper-binding protein [Sporichthyaceae bacterium]|nr:plastocyanin/azurin family copper-binding protein [Sporichthyaceae bacterium]
MTPIRTHRAPRRLHRSGRLAAASAAVLGSAALAVAGGAAPAAANPGTAELSQSIVISDNHFTPDNVGVHVGDKVTWVNTDEVAHNVESVSGPVEFGTENQVLHQGDKYSFRFWRPGIYHFVCTLHHGMRGTVRVGARQHSDVPPSDDWSGGSTFGPGRPPNHGPR